MADLQSKLLALEAEIAIESQAIAPAFRAVSEAIDEGVRDGSVDPILASRHRELLNGFRDSEAILGKTSPLRYPSDEGSTLTLRAAWAGLQTAIREHSHLAAASLEKVYSTVTEPIFSALVGDPSTLNLPTFAQLARTHAAVLAQTSSIQHCDVVGSLSELLQQLQSVLLASSRKDWSALAQGCACLAYRPTAEDAAKAPVGSSSPLHLPPALASLPGQSWLHGRERLADAAHFELPPDLSSPYEFPRDRSGSGRELQAKAAAAEQRLRAEHRYPRSTLQAVELLIRSQLRGLEYLHSLELLADTCHSEKGLVVPLLPRALSDQFRLRMLEPLLLAARGKRESLQAMVLAEKASGDIQAALEGLAGLAEALKLVNSIFQRQNGSSGELINSITTWQIVVPLVLQARQNHAEVRLPHNFRFDSRVDPALRNYLTLLRTRAQASP